MFVPIYTGCMCGETWRVSEVKIIDTDRDDVEYFLACDICYQIVDNPKMENGSPCVHEVTDEEWEHYFGLQDDDIDFYPGNF